MICAPALVARLRQPFLRYADLRFGSHLLSCWSVAAVTAYSEEQEQAVLAWLSDRDVAVPQTPGMNAELLSAITVSLIAEGAVNVQMLRLAGKQWVLDG